MPGHNRHGDRHDRDHDLNPLCGLPVLFPHSQALPFWCCSGFGRNSAFESGPRRTREFVTRRVCRRSIAADCFRPFSETLTGAEDKKKIRIAKGEEMAVPLRKSLNFYTWAHALKRLRGAKRGGCFAVRRAVLRGDSRAFDSSADLEYPVAGFDYRSSHQRAAVTIK